MTEHLDVLIVGAGLSGIGAGHYIQTDTPGKTYAIFEARGAMGGTWDLFRYPGVRSDSDMFTLGFSFRPWQENRAIADGQSILDYINETAEAEGIDQHIRYHHRVVAAAWSTDDALWRVTAERTDPTSGATETFELTCSFLFSCTGYYRYDQGYQPGFPGMNDFAGTWVHPQHWPDDLDYAGKRVVVIGSGATAVTLVPSMADRAAHVTMLQRSPSYIAAMPANDPIAKALRTVLPRRIEDTAIRWAKALGALAFFQLSRRFPEQVKKVLLAGVRRQLPSGYDVETHFTPRYNPWDQRVCLVPDADLFKRIREGSVDVVTDHIDTISETGIRLESGRELEADIIVSATGLDLLFLGGMQLSVDGEPVDVSKKFVYKGMMLEGVPNLALAVGYTNASWTLKVDLTCDYVTRLLRHMDRTGTRQCTAVNDDPTIVDRPLLDFTSGYVVRASDRFPRQGSRDPWQVSMNYVRDYIQLKRRPVVDDAMRFTNATGGGERAVSEAASASSH